MILPYKLVDLTHALDGAIPIWNGGCGFNHDGHIDYSDCEDEYKFRVMKVKMQYKLNHDVWHHQTLQP